jgi:hypothetical protein
MPHVVRQLALGVFITCILRSPVPVLAQAAPISDELLGYISRLTSPDSVEVRIAQAHIAHKGARTLPILDHTLKQADARQQQRLKELIALMLVRSVDLQEMKKYPKLLSMAETQFKIADNAANLLERTKDFDGGEQDIRSSNFPKVQTPLRKAVDELTNLGGYAVPALDRLAHANSPSARLYAAEILIRQGAEGQIATLLELAGQELPVTKLGGDVLRKTTLAKSVMNDLRTTHPFVRRFIADPIQTPAFEAEEYVRWLDRFQRPELDNFKASSELRNRLRQEADTLNANSWPDYWKRAKPVLDEVWK